NTQHEQLILGRAMQCLDWQPMLSGPLLHHEANWHDHEAIQVCPEDLSTEDVMRTFDSLPVDHKLSVSYLARGVRIDGPRRLPDPPAATVEPGITTGAEP